MSLWGGGPPRAGPRRPTSPPFPPHTSNSTLTPSPRAASPKLRAPTGNSLLGRAIKAKLERAAASGLKVDSNCFGTGPTLETYFNTPAVKTAFHVAPAIQWELCSGNGTFNYNPDIADERKVRRRARARGPPRPSSARPPALPPARPHTRPPARLPSVLTIWRIIRPIFQTVYPDLVNSAGYNVLIYNGEADLCVPYTDNEWWSRVFAGDQGLTVTSRWQPWNYQGDTGATVGGYRIRYSKKFTFSTIRGAGHMVVRTTSARVRDVGYRPLRRRWLPLLLAPPSAPLPPSNGYTSPPPPAHPQPETRPAAAFNLLKTFITTGTV